MLDYVSRSNLCELPSFAASVNLLGKPLHRAKRNKQALYKLYKFEIMRSDLLRERGISALICTRRTNSVQTPRVEGRASSEVWERAHVHKPQLVKRLGGR